MPGCLTRRNKGASAKVAYTTTARCARVEVAWDLSLAARWVIGSGA